METPKNEEKKPVKKQTPKTRQDKKTTQPKKEKQAKPKKEKQAKPKASKTPKTTKPKVAKVAKPKVAKPKKLRTQKAKIAKTPKAIKPKKVKKAKKKKTLKAKILTIAVSSALILSMLLGIGSVFVANDFAMTTILSGNTEKSLSVVDSAILKNFNSRYLDMKVESSITTIATGYVNSSSLAYLKLIKYDNNTFGFTGTYEMSSYPYLVVNYKNGKFFNYIPEHNYSSQNTQTVRSALTMLMPYFSENHILPTTAATVVDFVRYERIKSSFALSTKPVYFGQRFEISYNGLPTEKEVYEIDHLGNLRKRIYTREQAGYIYRSEITYLTVNKIFELSFHPNFVV